jgi:succinate dehydrogenase / fumarate reductase cytochrome b subunit
LPARLIWRFSLRRPEPNFLMAQAPNASSAPSRPVSPHLQIWRWHVTMLASILHRITGIGLTLGTLGIVVWLVALAAGPETFNTVDTLVHTPLVELALYALIAALGFHLLAGLRHLILDAGIGFKRGQANLTAWICVAGMIAAPIALWLTLNALTAG